MSGSVEDLSEVQKDSLRLLYRGYNAKEIARIRGVHPATVHQRLTAARKTLGVSRSTEAARIFAEAEGAPIYDRVLYDEIDIAPTPPDQPSSWLSRLPWPLPTRRRPTNDLSMLVAGGDIGTGISLHACSGALLHCDEPTQQQVSLADFINLKLASGPVPR